jgi:hypothetical protein
MADLPVVEVEAARAEDLRREVELGGPVVDDRPPEELARPLVHLRGHSLGDAQKDRVTMDGELQIALVVQRHRRHLAQCVLAVEHPAVRAGQQRVRDVADARLDRRMRPRRRAGALNPLPPQIGGNLAADECGVSGLLDGDVGSRDPRGAVEEAEPLLVPGTSRTALDAGAHEGLAVSVEVGQRFQRLYRGWCEDVRIRGVQGGSNLQRAQSHSLLANLACRCAHDIRDGCGPVKRFRPPPPRLRRVSRVPHRRYVVSRNHYV